LRSPILYETVPRAFNRAAVRRVAIAAVASPSAVDALAAAFAVTPPAGGSTADAVDYLAMPLASIGRTTSDAIHRHGREPAIEAAYPSFERLAEAIAAWAVP
jgi:uroporphyrinogen-III synthase